MKTYKHNPQGTSPPEMPVIPIEEEKSFLKTFGLIRRIVKNKLWRYGETVVDDVQQTIAYRLWKWRTNGSGHNLTEEEWRKMASTASQNEIKRFYKKETSKNIHISLSDGYGLNADLKNGSLKAELRGNSEMEVNSMLIFIWEIIAGSSPLERYALLFQRPDLMECLLSGKCCVQEEVLAVLDLTNTEFLELIENLPISDKDIALFIERKLFMPIRYKHVFDARYRITARIKKALIQADSNDGTLVKRKAFAAFKGQT